MNRYIGAESDAFPYAAVTYIESTFPDGSAIYGSGALVGANDVLTAAHIIYDPQRGGQAIGVSVAPGRDGNRYPFDSFQGVSLDYYKLDLEEPNSIRQSESQKDLAVIGLEYALGDELGWFELAPFSEDDDYAITGYPGKRSDSQGPRMVETHGDARPHSHYDIMMLEGFDISHGSSGSPVWTDNDGTQEVAGVLSTQRWGALVEANQQQLQAWIDGNDGLIQPMPESDEQAVESSATNQQPTPEPRMEPIPEPRTELTPEPRMEPIPEPRMEPIPEPRTEPTPEPRTESTPEPRTEPTPEPRTEPDSQPDTIDLLVARIEEKGWPWPDDLTRELKSMETLMRFPQLQETMDPVIRLYIGMLGRQADREGLEYWIQQVNAGNNLNELAKGFISSAEFLSQVEQQGEGDGGFIDALYHNILGRGPDNEGRVYWLNRLLGDTGDEEKAQIALSFTNSDEYVDAGHSLVQATKLLTWGVNLERMNPESLGFDGAFLAEDKQSAESIVRLYTGVLDRTPDLEGLEYWLEVLKKEGDLLILSEAFLKSEEFLGKARQLSVDNVLETLYRHVLEREPDASGERYWLDRFEEGDMALGDLVLAFTESPEFKRSTQSEVDDYLEDNFQVGLTGIETNLETYLLG